jgi:predicted phosphate transport protein (TIGR00153 family)
MPKSPFLQMFARSPFEPMQQHITKAQACALELTPFLQAAIAGDWDAAEAVQQRIAVLEDDADKLKSSIRRNLPNSVFLPVSRTDLLELVRMSDKIANVAKDISGLMLGRKMTPPAAISDRMLKFLEAALQTSQQAVQAMEELDELLASGFRGREVDLVDRLITELDRLENETDIHERELRAALFAAESELNPVDVIFLYRIIEWIGDLANRAQQVGSRLQILVAR